MHEYQDNDNVTIKGELKDRVGKTLCDIASNLKLGVDYFTMAACALEILEEYIGKDYDFPIEIETVAEKAGIEVVYQPLNGSVSRGDVRAHKVVGKTIKRRNIVTQESVNCILLDSESSKSEQRYALAHELAHYLLRQKEESYSTEYCLMPMLFTEQAEMIADIFAIFLLIPLPIFLKEFSTYIGIQPVPIETSEWLEYLSFIAKVPYEYVAIGYQNIRYVSCMVYNCIREGVNMPIQNELIEDIISHQFEIMKNAITEEVKERLFY